MELVETITLTSTVSSFTFSNIPQDAEDLYLFFDSRNDVTTVTQFWLRFNGDGGSNYDFNGFGRANFNTTNATNFSRLQGAYTQRNDQDGRSYTSWTISDYTSNLYKVVRSDGSGINEGFWAGCGVWNSTAAITSITCDINSGNYTAGTTASLYKLKTA